MTQREQRIHTRDIVKTLIPRYAKGKALDIGGGKSKYRELIIPHVSEYLVSDLYPAPGVDFIEDARNLKQPSNAYDTVLSFQALEHIDDTQAVVREMRRVLKKSGVAIVTAPFIAARHGHPSDFHRFTVEGLKWHFEREEFTILESGTQGSTFSVVSELLRFSFLSPYKKHSRIKRAVLTRIIGALLRLDRAGFLQNGDLYANVYLVARK